MTIKARNRFYLVFFIFSLALLVFDFVLYHYQKMTGTFSVPEVYSAVNSSRNFLLASKASYAFCGLYFELTFIITVSVSVLYAFYKTQAGELGFFLIYLLSLFLNTFRIFIPLFSLAQSYSFQLIFFSNFVIMSELLAPVSMLCMVLLSDEEYRQNLEQNCLIVIIICAFLAYVMPVNTGVIFPNFEVSSSFHKFLCFSMSMISLISIICLCIKNSYKEYNQMMSVGFTFLCIGTQILFSCSNLIQLILGVIFIIPGVLIYLKELHYQYMWT